MKFVGIISLIASTVYASYADLNLDRAWQSERLQMVISNAHKSVSDTIHIIESELLFFGLIDADYTNPTNPFIGESLATDVDRLFHGLAMSNTTTEEVVLEPVGVRPNDSGSPDAKSVHVAPYTRVYNPLDTDDDDTRRQKLYDYLYMSFPNQFSARVAKRISPEPLTTDMETLLDSPSKKRKE